MSDKPIIKYEWSVAGRPPLSRIQHGRRLTIDPGKVTVTFDRSGPIVYIEGRTIKANGDYGQHRRAHWFEDSPPEWSGAAHMTELPYWAVALLNHARLDRHLATGARA